MKTVKNVVDAVYALLPVTVTPLYKYSTPDDYTAASFYVVNALTIPKDPIQTVEFNVNCYAVDLHKGVPDVTTLATMADLVINALHDYNNDVFDIEYSFMNMIRVPEIQSHYFNLRFQLVFISN
jgi:hypothetical protein